MIFYTGNLWQPASAIQESVKSCSCHYSIQFWFESVLEDPCRLREPRMDLKKPLQSREPPKALQKTTGKSLGSGYVRQAVDQQLTQRRSPTTDSHGNSWLLGYPPWPSLLLIMQPDHHQLPDEGHVDASLSADALSM